MKTPSLRRASGFTLVELLVVIAIIAVLAAAGFAAGNAAINRARKVTAQAAASSLETAITSYYNEYSSLPDVGQQANQAIDTKEQAGVELLRILLGMEDSSSTNPQNPREIKFLTVKEGKANKNGLMFNSTGSDVLGLYDPWGGGYQVVLDMEYEDKLQFQMGSKTTTLNGRRVAVYNAGADKKFGTGDDVKTW